MRLPWATLELIQKSYIDSKPYSVLGCLSFEERCREVPIRLKGARCSSVHLIEIHDPEEGNPAYCKKAQAKILENHKALVEAGVKFSRPEARLLATEDEIISLTQGVISSSCKTLLFDITSFPKRFFALMLKRILAADAIENVVITYTQVGPFGYASGHLSEDSMDPDHLPGFAPPIIGTNDIVLAISLGFEALNVRSIIETYSEKRFKVVLPFPPNGDSTRRVWSSLATLTNHRPESIRREDIRAVAAWDAETVYSVLQQWRSGTDRVNLVPFGPKPHTLGMTLFAIENDSGMFYTQPRAYNPDYSKGAGQTWAYVVKAGKLCCFEDARRTT
jgi:hypothetical protein